MHNSNGSGCTIEGKVIAICNSMEQDLQYNAYNSMGQNLPGNIYNSMEQTHHNNAFILRKVTFICCKNYTIVDTKKSVIATF